MPVNAQSNVRDVQEPPLGVPTLNCFTVVSIPPGRATLNWKVTGPGLVSVAVATQAIMAPIFCGDARDGFIETILTVARAGAQRITSTATGIHQARIRFNISPRSFDYRPHPRSGKENVVLGGGGRWTRAPRNSITVSR